MTECSCCGDCCERITFWGDWNTLQQWANWGQAWREWAMYNLRDGEDGGMDSAVAECLANADFILSHWRPIAEDAGLAMPRFQCSAFDPVTRLCTAHSSRPPICRGYPWYNDEPGQHPERLMGKRCSFWTDVPLEQRPGGNLRSLPVLVGM